MRDICAKVDTPAFLGGIDFDYFVYEMELHKLSQPFCQLRHYLYLFVHGEGVLQMADRRVMVKPGTLVLIHPWQLFRIVETKGELTYLYITFSGEGVEKILSEIGATEPMTAYEGYEHLIDFWMKSIRRLHEKNALYVTESVFAATLSYLVLPEKEEDNGDFAAVLRYIQEHLAEPELSLRAVAGMFFYSEKYFSALFREKTGLRFTDHLSELRIHHALSLIDGGMRSVAELSSACGFINPTYFSKVFKKTVGKTPALYIRDGKPARNNGKG